MLDSSGEGSKPSTPSSDAKSKARGGGVYVPRHRRDENNSSNNKSVESDNIKKDKDERSSREVDKKDSTPNKTEALKKNEGNTTPIKDNNNNNNNSPSSSPKISTTPSKTKNSKSTPTRSESNSEIKCSSSVDKKTSSKPKTKTVIVPLSLLDISDETPPPITKTPTKEDNSKSTTGAQKTTPSVSENNNKESDSGSTPTTTPLRSSSSSNPPTPSSSSKKIPTHSISLVSLDDSNTPPSTPPNTKKETTKDNNNNNNNTVANNTNINNNNGKEGEAESGSEEEEWETSWEATLETMKVTPSKTAENSNNSKTSKSEKSETPTAVRGRGRKKFDDEGAEIGSSHPDVETEGGYSNISTSSSVSSSSGEGSISSVDRADAQKQFSHMLEIHSFPLTTTTEHLNDYLKDYTSLYRLNWVNDTSALAIFKTPKVAADALAKIGNSSKYKMRPISEASEESLAKASRVLGRKVEEKVTPRPYQTTTTVARRLIANALNMSFKPAANEVEVDQMRETKRKMWEEDDV